MIETNQFVTDEARYHLLKLLSENSGLSQRDLANSLGISLGKTNYCIRALVDLGWVKVVNFHNSRRKAAYLYKLTPSGISAKARATQQFLKKKLEEYKKLEEEIRQLKQEAMTLNSSRRSN